MLSFRGMADFKSELEDLGFKGEVKTDASTKGQYSHDASMFELVPKVIVYPKDAKDIGCLIDYATNNHDLSITVRSAGTDMGGGAISESIVMDITRHFNKMGSVTKTDANVEPGVFYRDFERATLKHGALMPSYPASRELCTVGGMVANNSGGEKSLEHGKTERFVTKLKVVLGDGNEYTTKPLNKKELDEKMAQNDFEGKLYKQIFELVDKNYDVIKAAKPNVSKDSTAYHVWNVWDKEKDVFDINQLIIGSQGTLGVVTDINFKLVPASKHSGILSVFLRDTSELGDIINVVLKHRPATFEGFDNYTLMLSFKLFYYFHQQLGWLGLIKLGLQLLPTLLRLAKGIPKMVLLIEFEGDSPEEVADKIHSMRKALEPFDSDESYEEDETEDKAKKFKIMRRESFNLLRKKVKDKHTAPFIDDLVVPPEHLPEFLPKLRKIINKYKLLATVAGHMGDGNFHVIPLMDIEDPAERKKLEPCMKEVNELVLSYGGSLSGEHNDGMIRGPWLDKMYSKEMMQIFKKIKSIFDPQNIFNPHKKTDAKWDYSFSHIRDHF